MALAERTPEAMQRFEQYVASHYTETEDWMELGLNYVGANGRQYSAQAFGLPPQIWVEANFAFDEVAALVAQRLGISIEQAREFLSQLTGFSR